MTLFAWAVSSLSTTFLVAVLGWLLRNLILTRLKATVQHEFDAKLESLRADLRKSEEAFKADLRVKEGDIHALREGALSGMAVRHATLDKRRLEAIDHLWSVVGELAPFKAAASILSVVRFEASLEEAAKDPKVRKIFEDIGKPLEASSHPKLQAHESRPYVSEMAWALFSAYRSILAISTGQLLLLQHGLNKPKLLKTAETCKLVAVALPEYKDYIEEYGHSGLYHLLEPLEEKLMKELQRIMRGEESDITSVEQAARIMKQVSIVDEAVSSSKMS
jgi:hypothetical protein